MSYILDLEEAYTLMEKAFQIRKLAPEDELLMPYLRKTLKEAIKYAKRALKEVPTQ